MNNLYLLILCILPFIVRRKSKRITTAIVSVALSVLYSTVALCQLMGVESPIEFVSFSSVGALFALMFSIVFSSTLLIDQTDSDKASNELSLFYGSALLMFIALEGVVDAGNTWSFLLNWELMSLGSFLLIVFDAQRRETLHSAIVYFVVMHVGFFFLLGGFSAIGLSVGNIFGSGTMSFGVWLLFFVGFALKSAVFPLHFWMLSTYRAANGTAAALLSGGATNIGLYGLWCITSYAANVRVVAFVMICAGLASALFGAFRMIRARTLWDTLSYSSIDNLGIIVFAFGLGFYGKAEGASAIAVLATSGAMLRLFTHATSKSLLFNTIGVVKRATGTDSISALGGLCRRMPLSSTAFAFGGLSIASMPIFGGFVSEFLIFSALFIAIGIKSLTIIAIVGVVVMALASASTIFNISKAFGVGFLGHARSEVAANSGESQRVDKILGYSIFATAISVVAWGLAWLFLNNTVALFNINDAHTAKYIDILFSVGTVIGILVAMIGALLYVRYLLTRKRKNSIAPTWSCAYDKNVDAQIQYTAESFAGEATLIMELPKSGHSTGAKRVQAHISPMSFMRRWTARLALLQTGRTSHYILHILLFLAAVLILTLFGSL